MARISMNGDQFAAELTAGMDELVSEYIELLEEVYVGIAEAAERSAPVLTGHLANSIAASAGKENKKARGGSQQVRRLFASLSRKKIPKIFLMVNDPKASLLENGTRYMAARPFFRAAIRSQENKRR